MKRKTLVRDLPLGWKQKLSFSVSIVHDPRIVFLDESYRRRRPRHPTSVLGHLIYAAADRRYVTLFVTTHYMDEAEQYCNRVSIMVDGVIAAALDSPANLRDQYGRASMEDVFYELARNAKRKGD